MRFFRVKSVAVYEAIRAELDVVYGWPDESRKTYTAIEPASPASTDASGRVYIVASQEECEFPAIQARLPALLANGDVEEISESTFRDFFKSNIPGLP